MSQLVYTDVKFANDPHYQAILIECEGCGGTIRMPVPKDVVLSSPLPVVPITYVHGSEGNRHAIIAHLDHQFKVRTPAFFPPRGSVMSCIKLPKIGYPLPSTRSGSKVFCFCSLHAII